MLMSNYLPLMKDLLLLLVVLVLVLDLFVVFVELEYFHCLRMLWFAAVVKRLILSCCCWALLNVDVK